MLRTILVTAVALAAAIATAAAVAVGPWWWIAAVPLVLVAVTGVYDLVQKKHSVLRNYPVIGHLRYRLESIRPELQQYFVERDYDGKPFDRDTRSTVYERAKGAADQDPFGTELSV